MCTFKVTHARDFIVGFYNFWHHSIIDKPEAQNFKKFVKLSVKSLYIIGFSPKAHRFTQRFRQKRYVSLRVFTENEKFRFFSEYAIYCRKRTVLLRVFANND
jgi:hypothetical protein